MTLSPDQVQCFQKHGYLILRDLLTPAEVIDLKSWAKEVHGWKPTVDSVFMPYEVCESKSASPQHEGVLNGAGS
jgi:hypothetical protein